MADIASGDFNGDTSEPDNITTDLGKMDMFVSGRRGVNLVATS